MALSPHVEVEAAKFLQKLIQESTDEPVKLATKLFVICHHMKLSGKEHSLPYQVISRAMETVLAQHGLDRNVLRSSSLVLASGSLSADVNSQSTKPGNESRMSVDTGSAEVQKAKGKDMSGTSILVDTDTLALRSRAIMGNEKAKEVMDSTLRSGPFTSVGSSVACQMGSSGNDSSKYGPKDTKKDSVTDYNRSSKLLHTDASCFEYCSVQNSQSLEAESSAVRTLDGSKNLDLQRKDSVGSDVQPSGKCLVEGPGKKAPAKRKRAASGTSLKDDRPLTRQQRKQMSFEINEGKQELPTNDCISAEEETQASKVFQPPCPVSHNDQPQPSSAFSRVAHTQGLPSQVTCAVDKNFVDGNACVLTKAGGGNVQVSQGPSLDFNGHFGRDIKQMYKSKEPSSERDSLNHLKQGNEDIPIADVKFDGTVIQSSDQTFHDEPFKPPTSQQTDLSCMPEHLQARESSGAQANVNVSSGGLSLVNFGCNVPCQKMIGIDTMPPFGAASGTSLKDDHPQTRQQENNLSFGTNESNQEVVTKDYISADGETKDVKSFQLPCPVPQNDQPQFSSTFSKVPDTQGLHSQVTCAVDMNFVHVNASHLTKVGGGNGEVLQAKTVSFDDHFGRDIKQMLKTTEASSESDASDHLKLGNKGMLADPKFTETTNQSSDKTPHDEPFKSPTDQQTDLSCMPEHLQTKDSSGVKAVIEIPSGGPSLDDFGCNVACQIIPGIDTMPHNGAQGVQESSHRLQSSQPAKDSTEKTVVPQKYKDSHFNISKEMQDSSAHGLKCPLKDSSESAQIVSNIGIWNQTKVDTASQMSAVPIVPSNANVQHSVIDSIPPAQKPPHGISDRVSPSLSKGLGSDNAQSSPATSGKRVTMFPKYQAEEVGNDQVSIKEQHHAVAHTSWAMKEEMAPRLGEVESSMGVSDVGLRGQCQSPMDLGPDNHSVPVKTNNGIHSSSLLPTGQYHFRVHVHHAPGTENSNSDSIPCQARPTHPSKVAPNEQLQQQSSSTSRIVSNVGSLSNELVCKKSLTFSNVMIDNEEGKLEQVKTPVLSESDRSLDAHLCSTADRGEGCLSTQKSTGLETRVSPPLTNQCRVSQDISRHTSSSHQIEAASAQGGGKLDAEASAEQRMQRNEKNGGRENVSTIKSVSTGLVNDAKSELNVTIESMKAERSSSQNNPNHGFVVQVPFFPNSPFRDYQLKQLRAQCLVFLAFRNKIPPKTAHLEVALDVNNTKIKGGTSESETGKNQKHGGVKEELFEGKACEGPSNAAQERKMMESKETETEKPLTPKLTPVASCSGSPIEAESSSKELEPTKKGKRRKYPRIDPNLTKEERKQVMAARRKAEAAEQAQERAKSKTKQCKSSQLDSQSQIRVAGLDAQPQSKVAEPDAQPQSKVAEPDAQPQTKVAGLDQQPLKSNVQGLDEQIQTKVAGPDAQLQTKITGPDAQLQIQVAGPDAQLQIQVAGPDAQLQIQVAGPDAQLQTKLAEPDAQLQTKVAGRDSQLQTKVAVPDAQLQIKVAGPDAQPQTNVAGLEAQPQTKVPELDAEPQTKVPGLDAEPQTSVVGLDAQPETKVAGLAAQPETKVAGPDVQPETDVEGLDAQPQTKVAGPDAQPQSKVAGPETLPQTKVAGLETLPQTQFAGTETLPQSKVEIVALVKTQEDSAKITSNPQEANENNMSNPVPSSGKQLEIESSGMLEVGGSHASAKDNWTIADGKQPIDIKKTEEPIMNTQDTDGKKQVTTTHPVSSPNLVAGSHTDGLISSSPKNRMIRLPNGESITLERFMQIAKSMKFPMMAQNTGVLTKPVMGESTATGSESLTAKGMSESYSQLGGSFPQHAGKQASLDVHWKTSSSATINNGALPINSKFQNGNQNMAVDQEEKDSSPEDSPAFLSKPSYTTVEKWILDQRKRKQLEEQNWAQKQRKTEAKIAVCFHHLKEVVSSSEDISAKTKSVIELKKLQLLQLQRRLRGDFLHDFFKPITSDIDISKTMKKNRPGRRMKQLERLELKMKEERQRRARERQKEFFSDIEAHKEKMDDWYKIKRERYRGFNRYVKEFHKRKDRTYREKVERIQREKINLLKNNDVEGYLRMVQDAKSDRVKQLLKETEGYIQKLGLKLQKQKVMAKRLESEMDETRIFNEINGNELGSTTTEENDQAQHYLESNEKYYLMAHSVKEIIYEQPYSLEGGKLREYQMNGLRWLVSLYNNHLNGILADEMGLGKTVQVIALICYLMETKNDRGPFLVVVPSSVLSGWVNEISFWAPSISKIAYMGSPDERRRLFREKISQNKFNVLLTTYEYLMNKHDRPKLSKIPWHYVIIDEGHRIKNASCKLNAELKHYQSTHRLLLTGTPLQNNLEELWALLNFLLPNIFNSSEDFSQWFSKPFENVAENSADQALLTEEENLLIINRLHQVLRPFMLRRLKHKVENQLPEKIERLVRCEASAYQKLLMKRVEENLGSLCHAKGRSVHNTVMELRNICNHPYLSQLHSDEVQSMLPPHYLPPVVRLCAKLEMLDRILPKLKATNHRVLLFSTMTRLLDVMEEYLAWKGYQYLRLDGHTSGNDRGALIEEFNRPDSEAFLFLLSIRAGGVGINLQAADTVIIFDTDWNPQVDLQAQARAHRIGQKRDVLVLRFETVHTVEEQVRAAAEHKLGVANQSITAGFFDNNTSPEDRRVYLEELLRGSKKEEDALVLDDEALNYLLARSESEIDIFEAVDGKRHQKEREEWLRCIQGKGGDEAMEMPPRLVVEEELKPLIMAMQAYDNANAGGKKRSSSALDTQHYGRGKRAREVRSYGDQLTEEEFERLCQAGVPDSPKNNDLGKDARKTKSAVQSVPTIGVNEPLPVKRGRGRPRRVPLPSVLPKGSAICSTDCSSSGIPVSTSVEKIDNLSMSSSAKPVSASVKENHYHPNFFSSHSNVQGNDNIESNVSLAETSVKNRNVENAPVFSEKSDIANGAKKDIIFAEINVENAAVFSEKPDIANGAKKDITFAEINVENAAIFSEKSDIANGAKKGISFAEINVENAAVFSEKSDIANGVTKADNEGNSSIEKEIDNSNFGDPNEKKSMLMCNVATEHVLEEQDKHNESIRIDSTIHKQMDRSIVMVTNDMQVIDGAPRNSDTSMLDVSKADPVTDKGKESAECQEDTAGSILNRTGSACPETNNPGNLVSSHADIEICAEQQVEEPINNPKSLATDIEVSNTTDVYKH